MYLWEIPACGATARPEVPALIGQGRSLSWENLNARVGRVAALLREHGLTRGERVGVLSHNSWRHAELYYGITLAGGVIVPLNWRLARPELARVASDAGLQSRARRTAARVPIRLPRHPPSGSGPPRS